MIRRLSLACLIVLCATDVPAQTVVAEFTIPPELFNGLPGYDPSGLPPHVSAQPINTDNDLATGEWLLHWDVPPGVDPASREPWLEWYRIVAVRDGQFCASQWFRPLPEPINDSTIQLASGYGLMGFIVNYRYRISWPLMSATYRYFSGVRIVVFDTPQCQ